MHTRLATSALIRVLTYGVPKYKVSWQPYLTSLIVALLLIALSANQLEAKHLATAYSAIRPAAVSFAEQGLSGHIVIQSPQIPELELVTHTVDMRFQLSGSTATAGELDLSQLSNEQVLLTVRASYRFHNTGQDGRTVRLLLLPSPLSVSSASFNQPQQVAVQIENQPVGIQSNAEGNDTIELAISPDQRRTVLLTYQLTLGKSLLPTIVYPVDWLDSWVSFNNASDVSLRFNIGLVDGIPAESWTIVAPEGWSYALSNNIQQPDVKWLYDGTLPESAIQFQFVHPLAWQNLQQNNSAENPTPAALLALGNTYRGLYLEAESVPTSNDTIALSATAKEAELFYAQAVAAYTKGLQVASETNDTSSASALLHARLAGLYRNKILGNEASSATYAALTTKEVNAALAQLPPESTLRAELAQWQIEGLYSLLQDAQSERRWDASLTYIDQLMSLMGNYSSPVINSQRLSDIRRIVIAQEALDLLEAGNKDAAISLAGADIANQDLQPPLEEQSLFTRWHITATVAPDRTYLSLNAFTDSQQLQRAQNGLAGLISNWQLANLVMVEEEITVAQGTGLGSSLAVTAEGIGGSNSSTDVQQDYPIHATLSIDNEQPRESLLQSLPDDANWALLKALLNDLTPQTEQSESLLMEEQSLAMVMDLRAAGDHWATMVAKLQRDAQQAENASLADATSSQGFSDPDAANAQLASRIRSVNFANEARVWQDLIGKSWVLISLTTDTVPNPVERSWIATVKSPPQNLQIEGATLATSRIAIIMVALFIFLLMLAGFLWWLI